MTDEAIQAYFEEVKVKQRVWFSMTCKVKPWPGKPDSERRLRFAAINTTRQKESPACLFGEGAVLAPPLKLLGVSVTEHNRICIEECVRSLRFEQAAFEKKPENWYMENR